MHDPPQLRSVTRNNCHRQEEIDTLRDQTDLRVTQGHNPEQTKR